MEFGTGSKTTSHGKTVFIELFIDIVWRTKHWAQINHWKAEAYYVSMGRTYFDFISRHEPLNNDSRGGILCFSNFLFGTINLKVDPTLIWIKFSTMPTDQSLGGNIIMICQHHWAIQHNFHVRESTQVEAWDFQYS